jgi:hypothetical protein
MLNHRTLPQGKVFIAAAGHTTSDVITDSANNVDLSERRRWGWDCR